MVGWVFGLIAIAVLAVVAIRLLGVTKVDSQQQQPLVWQLARGHLAGAMVGGTDSLPQTSGPGFGLFAAPAFLVVDLALSKEDGFLAVSFLCLVALGGAAVAASRAVGVAARSARELLNVAAVVLGIPVLACYSEYFHPADVLATAAVLGAFAACARGRTWWGFALLGFAVVTRQWAVIAVAVLAVLQPRGGRVRPVLVSAVVGCVLVVPFLVADPTRTASALTAADVVRGQLTAPALLPVEGAGRYVLSRIVPLLVVLAGCAWLRRREARFAPELAAAALAAALLARPLFDPAGFVYYLAPGWAFAVLIRPQSWKWPIGGLVGGVVLWQRRSLQVRAPAAVLDERGRHLQLPGSSLAVATTLAILLAVLLVTRRVVELVDAANPRSPGPQHIPTGPGTRGSGSETAAGRPAHAQPGDGLLG